MASVQEKYLLKWVWTLFSWHHWRQPPRPTSWANHPLCTSPVCLSKGHYCCSEFHRGLVKKRRSLLFKWFPTNYRGTRTPFISLSLCPLCSWCVFSPSCHSPNLSSRFFCIPSFILLNTPCNIFSGLLLLLLSPVLETTNQKSRSNLTSVGLTFNTPDFL